MKKDKLDIAMKIAENVFQDLKESTTTDIAQFPNLLSKIIRKVYTKSLVGEIADVQPLTGPVGKVVTVFGGYGGRQGSSTKLSTSKLLKLADSSGFNVDDPITTASASGVIEYIEDNFVLVRDITGIFAVGDSTLATITTIDAIYSNRFYAAKVLKNYAGGLLNMETTEPKDMNIEVKSSTIEAKTRKLRAIFTSEVIDDIKNMYELDVAEDLIADEFASEIIQEIDSEIIDYMRSIASVEPDLILSNSYGTQGDMMAVANDVYLNIYAAAMKIANATRRGQNFFIIADAKTIALLMVSPLHMQPGAENDNIYYKGNIGSLYDLYVDPYADADDHYCIIGYTNGFGGTGDAGLIYSPYTNSIIETTEQDTGKSVYFNVVRYGYTVHPQDTGTGTSDSIFFSTFNIDMTGVNNLTVFS